MDNSDAISLVYNKGQNIWSISYGLLGCLLRLVHMSLRLIPLTMCKMQPECPAFESMVWLSVAFSGLSTAYFAKKEKG